ncbi:MAG TPA: hypothetical protein VM053_01620 [Gemmatimonadaceae bacterium]|nr:hypothetical protein [Gemmatimonadaceae bacterium]
MVINSVRRLISAWHVEPYHHFRASDTRGFAYDRVVSAVEQLTKFKVIGGPYRGMSYFGPHSVPFVDALPTPKLLGSYEAELHPWIETLIAKGFRNVINIGGAEGYHAVGLAMRLPSTRVTVFDTILAARKAARQLAEQNRVRKRMQFRGFCDANALLDVELEGSLIFSDCAGTELMLLDPTMHPGLSQATLLVELHDYFDVRVTPRLIAQFGSTHSIEFVTTEPRKVEDYPLLSGMSLDDAAMALDERRKITRDGKLQRWALLTPAG